MTIHRRWLPILLLLAACVAWAAAPWVDLEKRFTAEQMHATGLDTLKPEQLALLNQLLRDEARDAAAVRTRARRHRSGRRRRTTQVVLRLRRRRHPHPRRRHADRMGTGHRVQARQRADMESAQGPLHLEQAARESRSEDRAGRRGPLVLPHRRRHAGRARLSHRLRGRARPRGFRARASVFRPTRRCTSPSDVRAPISKLRISVFHRRFAMSRKTRPPPRLRGAGRASPHSARPRWRRSPSRPALTSSTRTKKKAPGTSWWGGCMIVGNSGTSSVPSLYVWNPDAAGCGRAPGNTQALWSVYPVTSLSGKVVHVIRSQVNGKCLIRSSNGQASQASLHLWTDSSAQDVLRFPDRRRADRQWPGRMGFQRDGAGRPVGRSLQLRRAPAHFDSATGPGWCSRRSPPNGRAVIPIIRSQLSPRIPS